MAWSLRARRNGVGSNSRGRPGEDSKQGWRLPAGEVEQLVIHSVRDWLQNTADVADEMDATAIAQTLSDQRGTAASLPFMTTPEQRNVLLSLGLSVRLEVSSIRMALGSGTDCSVELTAAAKLVRKGRELRLAISPDGASCQREPDPVLLKLVAHARAAKALLVDGSEAAAVAHYGKRHLWQLLRINWLAPDILAAVANGTQPPQLTGRRLLRAIDIPLDWSAQRRLFGFG